MLARRLLTCGIVALSLAHLVIVAPGLVYLVAETGAFAQSAYPNAPIKLVVPFPPASEADVLMRLVVNEVERKDRWTFVIDNRSGVGSNSGLDAVARASKDGYTLGVEQTANLAINPSLHSKVSYDVESDFSPVVLLASQPMVLVVCAASPIKQLADLQALSKRRPLSMASVGVGSVGHITGEMFAKRVGINMMHMPYKGAGPAASDLLRGITDFYFATPPSVISLVKGGKLRALAVTSSTRLDVLPNVPTAAEAGYPGFVAEDWKAVVAPAGTPPEAIATINKVMNAALMHPAVVERLRGDGSVPRGGTAAELGAFMKNEQSRWGLAVRDSGAKLDRDSI